MSINSCTINGYTVNSLCSNRRQAIIDSLLGNAPPQTPSGGGGSLVRDTSYNNVFRRNQHSTVDEQDYVSVDVFWEGLWYKQTLDMSSSIQLVNVYDFKMVFMGIVDEAEIAVNIDDFHIRELK